MKHKGIVIISFDANKNKYLDYGSRKVELYTTDIDYMILLLKNNGCEINNIIELYDNQNEKIDEDSNKVATIIKAMKMGQ